MLYVAKVDNYGFWVYYVDKVIDLDQEIFVFKRTPVEIEGKYIQNGEHYFLHICTPEKVFESRKDDVNNILVNRFVSLANWKIYLWGKELVGISSKNKFLTPVR